MFIVFDNYCWSFKITKLQKTSKNEKKNKNFFFIMQQFSMQNFSGI